jgi:DNA-binding beta-propeller fold protein YncE
MVRSATRMSGVPGLRRSRIAVPAVLSAVALALGAPAAMAATAATGAHPRVIATVKVGTQPSDVAVSPVTGAAYVVSEGYHTGNLVTAISGKTSKLAGHVIVKDGVSISQSAVSPRTGDVYSIGSASDVSVISG